MMTPHLRYSDAFSLPFLLAAMALALLLGVAATSPARAIDIVGTSGLPLRLEMNEGRLVRLDRPASTVFIANPEIADIQVKSPTLIYLMGRSPGETTLYAVDEAEAVLANLNVSVNHNLSRLRGAIDQLYPGVDITVSSVDGAVVLDGLVDTPTIAEDIRRVTAQIAGSPEAVIMRVGVDFQAQINLRVRIAEVVRGVDKQLGFNWDVLGAFGNFTFGLATFNPFAANVTQNTLPFSFSGDRVDVNNIIDALEDEGLISVLAEPNLTALSGETANFLVGGEFPIIVPNGNGFSVVFKQFGVQLSFTPTIFGKDRINLNVLPEVSQLSNEGAVSVPLLGLETENTILQIPALTTRRAETTVELGSGQSFAIAGLIENNVTHDISKFPGLGDVPVLGRLFRSDRFQRDESELVIIVTPYIVRPTSRGKLAVPTDGLVPVSDIERLRSSSVVRRAEQPGRPRTIDRNGLTLLGPFGFHID